MLQASKKSKDIHRKNNKKRCKENKKCIYNDTQ